MHIYIYRESYRATGKASNRKMIGILNNPTGEGGGGVPNGGDFYSIQMMKGERNVPKDNSFWTIQLVKGERRGVYLMMGTSGQSSW